MLNSHYIGSTLNQYNENYIDNYTWCPHRYFLEYLFIKMHRYILDIEVLSKRLYNKSIYIDRFFTQVIFEQKYFLKKCLKMFTNF